MVFSTGSKDLDALLEELRAGDNVVWYSQEREAYLPFVSALLGHVQKTTAGLVYVRSEGSLDSLVAGLPGLKVLHLADLPGPGDRLPAFTSALARLGPQIYYLFESLASLSPWFPHEGQLLRFFLTVCPFLFHLDSVAYWHLERGKYSPATIAAIRDCTQVFIKVDRADTDLLVTPLKVWGRYSETMFLPHRVTVADGTLQVTPLPLDLRQQADYTQALAAKNRELAEIRDILDRNNQELKQRNQELAELNEKLSEQSRLYRSLQVNLDHLVALFQASQTIGSSLAVDQVRRAVVSAALRLLEGSLARLILQNLDDIQAADVAEGAPPPWADAPEVAALRQEVRRTGMARSLVWGAGGQPQGSVAVAALRVRGQHLGTLEVHAADAHLDTDESLRLLTYLASEASIALDNAYLYREVEIQGKQLRSFLENVIHSEEQESRRLAFDLHDGLVQLIVAAYQHLQSAQAWRGRDPGAEERELEQGVQLLRRAIYEARRLIAQLRPTGLDDFGLEHALRLYVAQLETEADWHVSLEIDTRWPKLPSALEAALFRIIQEASTNARKYADARRLQIRLMAGEEQLEVSIQDWGKGFDPAEVVALPAQGLHMGLIGIRERARLWGGHCVLTSQPGQGTTIHVSIPRARALAEQGDDTDDQNSVGG